MVSTLDPHHHLASLSEQICELSTTVDHPAWHVSIFQCPLAKFQLAKVEQTQEIEEGHHHSVPASMHNVGLPLRW